MKVRKFTRQEKKDNREQNKKNSMAGTGMYIFENNTNSELSLPKPTASGMRKVGPKGRFQGDSYFKQWMKPPLNLLKLIETITPDNCEALTLNEGNMQKLILDQPDTVTTAGKVEHVIEDKNKKINENKKKEQEVLLTEDPLDGIEILLG